ncbi:MAG: US12 family protein [Bacteroidales bacterium]|jgi:FtsH-binding integral membrane protein|nr:US12 family protein [Bacteroidales bacterium]
MEQTNSLSVFSARKEERLNSGVGDQISVRRYNAVMLLTLLWGFLVNTVMVYYFAIPIMRLLSGVGPLWIFIGYFVLAIAGIAISARSTNPWISFLGYNLLVLPIGVLLCLILPGIPVAIVTKALLLTGIVTATMTLLGLVAPNVFLGMGRTLFIALIVGILAELVATFLFHYTGTAFDWLFVVLFSGYIGYDVAKSQIYPKTVDNAVDCALDIYLDIINIFIRLLALLSRKE